MRALRRPGPLLLLLVALVAVFLAAAAGPASSATPTVAAAPTAAPLVPVFPVAPLFARLATGTCSGTTDVTCVDKTYKCDGPVDLVSLNVTIHAGVDKNGVDLGSGCTGHIGSLNGTTYNGDIVKVGDAHDLVVDGGTLWCLGKATNVHQDGVQVMNGQRITFYGLVVHCETANDSQAMIHEGAGLNGLPTDVVFDGGQFGDSVVTGAYGVSIGDSVRSGFRNAVICPAHLHTFYVGDGAQDPVTDGNSFPAAC